MVDAPSRDLSAEALRARLVRYDELVPGLNAFVDTRNPGSEAKENFTIIGPGVAENPDAHVHIRERHGFNIGGARQPPGCVNSQHSHDTAEVFVVFSGRWRFTFGAHGDEGAVEAGPGTVGSVPTQMFRGFTNVGEAPGFLWVALGGDDPGRVLWAPPVFDMAERYGLKLLADGTLVDTVAGEAVPPGAALMPRTTAEQVAARPTPPPERLAGCFVAPDALPAPDGWLGGAGVSHRLLIGPGAPLGWPHGFTLARIELADGATVRHAHGRPEVLFCLDGRAEVAIGDVTLALGPGDTFSVPAGAPRRLSGRGTLIAVRGGDELPDLETR
ncbi:MAG: cupin domain-containing protein [Sphingomonadaceae bacterium]